MKLIEQIRRALGIRVAIAVILAGICLITGCLFIYFSAEASPYSKEIVTDTFSVIAIPIYICIGLVAVNLVLGIFVADNENDYGKKKIIKDQKAMLNRAKKQKDINLCSAKLREQILLEEKKRKIAFIATITIVSVCGVVFLAYALNPGNYTVDSDGGSINGSIISAVYVLLACVVIGLAAGIGYIIFNQISMISEAELWKTAPVKKKAEETAEECKKYNKVFVARIIVGVLAVGFLIGGFAFGGARDVLTKAANICTECIGLG